MAPTKGGILRKNHKSSAVIKILVSPAAGCFSRDKRSSWPLHLQVTRRAVEAEQEGNLPVPHCHVTTEEPEGCSEEKDVTKHPTGLSHVSKKP